MYSTDVADETNLSIVYCLLSIVYCPSSLFLIPLSLSIAGLLFVLLGQILSHRVSRLRCGGMKSTASLSKDGAKVVCLGITVSGLGSFR